MVEEPVHKVKVYAQPVFIVVDSSGDELEEVCARVLRGGGEERESVRMLSLSLR